MENNEQINNSKFDLASFKKSQENMIVKNNAVDLVGRGAIVTPNTQQKKLIVSFTQVRFRLSNNFQEPSFIQMVFIKGF